MPTVRLNINKTLEAEPMSNDGTYHNIEKLPPPPSPENDSRQTDPGSKGGGITLSPKLVIDFARLYTQYRPIIGWGAKLAKQKIPKEFDEAMKVVAATGDPDALRRLQEEGQQAETVNMQKGPTGAYEVPPDTPGAPVMTDDMAETAYYLSTVKRWGVLQIAQYFTEKGSPVSKATVCRYIDDKREEYEEEEIARNSAFSRRLQVLALMSVLWFGSAVGLHYLLNFLHLL